MQGYELEMLGRHEEAEEAWRVVERATTVSYRPTPAGEKVAKRGQKILQIYAEWSKTQQKHIDSATVYRRR